MQSDITKILSAFAGGTAFGSVVTLLLKHHLIRRSERRRRQIETDRATYQERMTRLIAANLCALIRSNRYREGEREELAELVQELSDGAHQERFLDPTVHAAWVRLVKKSAECGWRRLTDVVTEQDIADYTQAWEAWLIAARESFGPLPENDRPIVRRSGAANAAREAA
jgi:hypothetical protein